MEQTTIIIGIFIFLLTTFLSWRILATKNRKQLDNNKYKKWKSKWIFWQSVIYPSAIAAFLIMFILKWTGLLTF